MIIDRRLKNKDVVAKLAEWYGVKKIVVSAYHSYANGMIECGHNPIIDILSNMSNRGFTNWIQNLFAVLKID